MACLVLLVGHLWTSFGCLWSPHSGSVYMEVSVSMTAVHTCALIWTLSQSILMREILDFILQGTERVSRFVEGHARMTQPDSCLAACVTLLLTEGEFFNYIKFPFASSWIICRGPWMCKLRCHLHPSVATGRYRALPVQRLWTVPQDERPEPTAHQAQT